MTAHRSPEYTVPVTCDGRSEEKRRRGEVSAAARSEEERAKRDVWSRAN
jgi:hypothetical protein|tara:strand:+ start:690 stop:836 length:147 start_codon:yes stop_codon:yes gene_type:complete